MVDMIVDERPFGTRDSVLDSLKLLREIDAGPFLFDHADDAAQVPGGAVQSLDDGKVTGVSMVRHALGV